MALVAVGGYGRGELSPAVRHRRAAAARRAATTSASVADRHLVPDLGRGPEARPRGAHASRRRWPSRPTTSTPPRRCSTSGTSPATGRSPTSWPTRPTLPVAQAGQALAGGAGRPGARPPRPGGRGGLPARARPQGGPGRAARRARPRAGPRRREPSCGRATTPALDAAYDTLLAARVELHRRTGRPGDRLLLQEQDAVAAALGYADADALMRSRRRAPPARSPGRSDDAWAPHRLLARRAARPAPAARPRRSAAGWCSATARSHRRRRRRRPPTRRWCCGPRPRPPRHGTRIDRAHARPAGRPRRPMPADAVARRRPGPRSSTCCSPGRRPSCVIEALDQLGLWERFLPEWEPVRSKPQRNAYHRFTVDRHLWEAAANAAALADRVDRPDLLVLGALLHDIGKGEPGDHTDVGIDLRRPTSARAWASTPTTSRCSSRWCRHHLLLPDVATRRDLDDPATIERSWPSAVGEPRRCSSCSPPSPRPTRWPPARRPGATGRPSSCGRWWRVPTTCSAAARPHDVRRRVPRRRASGRCCAAGEQVIARRGRPAHRRRRRPARPVQPGGRRAGAARPRRARRRGDDASGGWALEVFRVESSFGPTIAWDQVVRRPRAGARRPARAPGPAGRAGPRPTAPGGPAAAATSGRARGAGSTTRVAATPPWSRCTPPTDRRALPDHPRPRRARPRHRAAPRSRPSATGSSTRSTSATADGAKVTDPAVLAEIERALLHALEAQ